MTLNDKLEDLIRRMCSESADVEIGQHNFQIILQDADWLDEKALHMLLEEKNIKIMSIKAIDNRIKILGRFDI